MDNFTPTVREMSFRSILITPFAFGIAFILSSLLIGAFNSTLFFGCWILLVVGQYTILKYQRESFFYRLQKGKGLPVYKIDTENGLKSFLKSVWNHNSLWLFSDDMLERSMKSDSPVEAQPETVKEVLIESEANEKPSKKSKLKKVEVVNGQTPEAESQVVLGKAKTKVAQPILKKASFVDYCDEDVVCSKIAAELLGQKVKTLANWRTNGTGPTYAKPNGRIKYKIEDLKEYLSLRSNKDFSLGE